MSMRTLIVDDDPRFRALARRLIEASGHLVTAEAADGAAALSAARRTPLDAALVDVQLPDTDGLILASQLTADGGPRVVLTSTDPSLVTSAALARSGAVGFLAKDDLAAFDLARLLDWRPAG